MPKTRYLSATSISAAVRFHDHKSMSAARCCGLLLLVTAASPCCTNHLRATWIVETECADAKVLVRLPLRMSGLAFSVQGVFPSGE